jgi:hypothetical protein
VGEAHEHAASVQARFDDVLLMTNRRNVDAAWIFNGGFYQ